MLTHNPLIRSVAAVAALVLLATACGSESSSDSAPAAASVTTMEPGMEIEVDDHADDDADDDHAAGFAFGDPMDAADASRVIEIKANDDFTFDPSSITVEAGETVTLRVENVGFLDHDFTIGNEQTQVDHEAEMAEMAEMGESMATHDEANAFGMAAGETKEMTWHFTEAGSILMGCHTPGHYAAGMKGTINIEGE